jgi:hypothetical protein
MTSRALPPSPPGRHHANARGTVDGDQLVEGAMDEDRLVGVSRQLGEQALVLPRA